MRRSEAFLALGLTLLCGGCLGQVGGSGSATDLLPGEVAQNERAMARVPPPGVGVFVETLLDDGSMQTIQLETALDGRIVQTNDVDEQDYLPASASAPPAACADGAFRLSSYRWATTFSWRFKSASTPTYLNVDKVESRLVRAAGNITRSRNDCGLDDRVSATHAYMGRTSRGVGIRSDGTCDGTDGSSVVAFGALPQGTLGISCTWFTASGEALESDVRLNKKLYRWYVSRPAGCSSRFGIEAVMTHELGHTFGLAHVSEKLHGNLTMSPRLAACNDSARTLGLGDVKGLRQRY